MSQQPIFMTNPSVLGCTVAYESIQDRTIALRFAQFKRGELSLATQFTDGSSRNTPIDISCFRSAISGVSPVETSSYSCATIGHITEDQIQSLPVGGMAFIVEDCFAGSSQPVS